MTEMLARPHGPPKRKGGRPRLAAAAAALTLPVLLFLLLLQPLGYPQRLTPGQPTTVFFLPRLAPDPVTIDARGAPRQEATSPPAQLPIAPADPGELPLYAQPPSGQALLAALRHALACRMEQLGQPQFPGACRAQEDRDGGFHLPGTPGPVRDEARWAAAWANRQSPALLPCFSADKIRPDLGCALGKIANGSLPDPSTWPDQYVRDLPREEFARLQDAYAAFRREYGKAPRGALTSTAEQGK